MARELTRLSNRGVRIKGEVIRSQAPLRISFGGGGTDVDSFCQHYGGNVLSATIDKYAYCTLVPTDNKTNRVFSLDYDVMAEYDKHGNFIDGLETDFVRAVVDWAMPLPSSLDIYIHVDAPPGSGLGSSSALMVAIIGAVQMFKSGHHMPHHACAELAYYLERTGAGIHGGRQDHYAATYGGLNWISFEPKPPGDVKVIVSPVGLSRETLLDLNYCSVLCYTGMSRPSSTILTEQIREVTSGNKSVISAHMQIKAQALQMLQAVKLNDIEKFGNLLATAWSSKVKMAKTITNPQLDMMYDASIKAGAFGGKLLGAGGGGYLYFICSPQNKIAVITALETLGGTPTEFSFSSRGLEVWRSNVR